MRVTHTKLLFLLLFFLIAIPAVSLAENTVVIDPGHGGKAVGTCGYSGDETGVCEKDVNLLVAQKLKGILEETEYFNVKMTRVNDEELIDGGELNEEDLADRVNIANAFAEDNHNNSILISIHHNQDINSSETRGMETYYYDGENHFNPAYPPDPMQLNFLTESKRLAGLIHTNLLNNIGLRDRELRNNQSFFVIRNAQMPAVLVELGFMTNPDEERLITSEDFQQNAAETLANSIVDYYKVYEVFDGEKNKLETFTDEVEAIRFAEGLDSPNITVVDKLHQSVIYPEVETATVTTHYYGTPGIMSSFVYRKKLYDHGYQVMLLDFVDWNQERLFTLDHLNIK